MWILLVFLTYVIMFRLLRLRSHIAENTFSLNYKSAFFGVRDYLTENTTSVMETNQGQPRTSSGKMLILSAFKQNWNIIDILERQLKMWNFMKILPVGVCLLHADRHTDRQTDRQTWRSSQQLLALRTSQKMQVCYIKWHVDMTKHKITERTLFSFKTMDYKPVR